MNEKRFKVTDNTDNPFLCDWSVTDYADGGIVHHPMTSENMANVMCDLLNEQHETIERLNQQLRIFSDGLKAEIRETKEVFEDYSECVDEKKQLKEENKDLREQLILANAFIKMIENCYEDASIEDILYMKYGEFQKELHLQMAIAKEEL